jgi:hypothetical protein
MLVLEVKTRLPPTVSSNVAKHRDGQKQFCVSSSLTPIHIRFPLSLRWICLLPLGSQARSHPTSGRALPHSSASVSSEGTSGLAGQLSCDRRTGLEACAVKWREI